MPRVKQLHLRGNGGRTDAHPYTRDGRRRSRKQAPGLVNGILSFFSSIGFGSYEQDFESDSDSDTSRSDADVDDTEEGQQNHSTNNSQGQAASQVGGPSTVQLQPPSSSGQFTDGNQTALLEWATRKVNDKSPMNEMELRGLQAFFEPTTEHTYEPERLRFSSRPHSDASHSPGADSCTSKGTAETRRSGFSGMSTLPTLTNNVTASSGASSTRRMLKTDPNGEIKWRGAGRSRSSSIHPRRPLKVDSQSTLKSETSKRRKVTEASSELGLEASNSSPSSAGPTFTIGSAPKQEYVKKATNIGARPRTAPAVSSPLRNAISASPPASPPTSGRSTTSTAIPQTKAASLLSAIVEKATPPPKPDISNPYETAAPIKPVVKPKPKIRSTSRKRAMEEEKARDAAAAAGRKESLSAKSIIEATVPKGAKRSLPPPGIGKSANSGATRAVNGHSEKSSPPKKFRATVEDAPADDDAVEVERPVEIVEPQDSGLFVNKVATGALNNASAGSKKHTPAQSANPPFKSSTPKEPSKLRNTIVAADDSENENRSPSVSVAQPVVNGVKPMAPTSTNTNISVSGPPRIIAADWAHDAKGYAMMFGEGEVPVYQFYTSMPAHKYDNKTAKDAREFALQLTDSKLPKFDFSSCEVTAGPSSLSKATVSDPVPKSFDFAAAGMKPSSGLKDGEWECSTCMLKNPASATDKCITCEIPRPSAKAMVTTFDWTAAGMKPQTGATNGMWECGTCMLKNPASATEKCETCEAPRPGAKKDDAPPPFNWAASGMKMGAKPTGGAWTCGTCMLQNPATAVAKCTVCESPR